jgi:hypothetical protein
MRRMNVGLRTTRIVPQRSVVAVAVPSATLVPAPIVVVLTPVVLVPLTVVAAGSAVPVTVVLVAIVALGVEELARLGDDR